MEVACSYSPTMRSIEACGIAGTDFTRITIRTTDGGMMILTVDKDEWKQLVRAITNPNIPANKELKPK